MVDIITTKGGDIDLDTTIIMDIDIQMDVVIERNPDVMGIIKIKMIIETVADIIKTASTIKRISTQKIERLEILEHEIDLDNIDKHFYLSSVMRGNF